MSIGTEQKSGFNTKKLVYLALLLALTVGLMQFTLAFPFVNVSFSYLPIALTGMLFGPAAGAAVGFLSNELNALIKGFGFNPWYSLIPMFKGLLYGMVFFKRDASRIQIILCQLVISVALHLFANTLLLYLFYNKGALGSLPVRVLKNVMFFPVEVLTLIKMAQYKPVFARLIK